MKRLRTSSTRSLCDSGKVRYRSNEQATLALLKIQGGDRRDRTPIRVYACDDCGGYHLTSQETRGVR